MFCERFLFPVGRFFPSLSYGDNLADIILKVIWSSLHLTTGWPIANIVILDKSVMCGSLYKH